MLSLGGFFLGLSFGDIILEAGRDKPEITCFKARKSGQKLIEILKRYVTEPHNMVGSLNDIHIP